MMFGGNEVCTRRNGLLCSALGGSRDVSGLNRFKDTLKDQDARECKSLACEG